MHTVCNISTVRVQKKMKEKRGGKIPVQLCLKIKKKKKINPVSHGDHGDVINPPTQLAESSFPLVLGAASCSRGRMKAALESQQAVEAAFESFLAAVLLCSLYSGRVWRTAAWEGSTLLPDSPEQLMNK